MRSVLSWISIIVIIAIVVFWNVARFWNPGITDMQLFFRYWYLVFPIFGFSVLHLFITERRD